MHFNKNKSLVNFFFTVFFSWGYDLELAETMVYQVKILFFPTQGKSKVRLLTSSSLDLSLFV